MPASQHSISLRARFSSCRPTNIVKALKAKHMDSITTRNLSSYMDMHSHSSQLQDYRSVGWSDSSDVMKGSAANREKTHSPVNRRTSDNITRSHTEMVGDMSHVTLNSDLSKIHFVHF